MPIAIVVHSVIENHCQILRMGVASGPPIRTLPRGETTTPTIVKTKPKTDQTMSVEKCARIQSFNVFAKAKKLSRSIRLAIAAAMKRLIGTNKTKGLSVPIGTQTSLLDPVVHQRR